MVDQLEVPRLSARVEDDILAAVLVAIESADDSAIALVRVRSILEGVMTREPDGRAVSQDSGLAAVVAVVTQVAQIAEGVRKILDATDGARVVTLNVENHTDLTFTRRWVTHAHGDWGVPPWGQVDPNTAQIFSARDTGVFTGTEGSVVYSANDGGDGELMFTITWNNPFIGPNRCGGGVYRYFSRFPPTVGPAERYRFVHTCGGGNKSENRYEIRRA
jgi:hypothetical protein